MAALSKLSNALEISLKELLLLETGNSMDEEGKLENKEYLEIGLPESLQHSMNLYRERKEKILDYSMEQLLKQ